MSNTVNWAIVPLTITAKTPRSFYGMLVTRKGVEYLAVKESRKGELSLAYYGKDKAEFNFGRRTRGAAQGEIDVSLLSGRFEPVAFALTLAGEGVVAELGHKAAKSSKARVAFGDGAGAAEAPAEAPTMADLMASLATAAAPPAPEAAPEAAPEPEALPSLEVIMGAIEAVEGQIEATKQGKVLAAKLGMSTDPFEAKQADLTLALADLNAKAEAAAAAAAAELEDDVVEAFVLTPAAIAERWGDADGLMALAKQAGLDVGRTKSASGLGGLLMAALQ
jgi:hypothetical protein